MNFWVRIDSYYGINQGLIHDAKYVDIVYEIVNLDNPSSRTGERQIKRIKKKWHDLLLTLHHKQNHPEQMNEEEKRVYQMFLNVNEPDKFLNAAHRKRLRFQQGMKENFLAGLKMSGRYLPLMEDVFRKEGLADRAHAPAVRREQLQRPRALQSRRERDLAVHALDGQALSQDQRRRRRAQ